MAPSVSGRAARTSTASAAAAAARKPSGPPGWRPGAIGRDRPSSPAPEVTALFQESAGQHHLVHLRGAVDEACLAGVAVHPLQRRVLGVTPRSDEHTSELQSLMRTSYAVFRLKNKHTTDNTVQAT